VFPAGETSAGFFALGVAGIDDALGGGLARGTLHEVFAAGQGDEASAAAFALALASLTRRAGAILWIRQDVAGREAGHIHAPGIADMGIDPNRLVMVAAREPVTALRAAAEALRCTGFAAVLTEIWGAPPVLDLTATRRLYLTAAQSGVTAFLVRAEAGPAPSAAMTRWQVKAAPSSPLAANAPGHPVFEISLIRHRAGLAGRTWHVEWSREECSFRDPAPLSGAVVPVVAGRPPSPGDVETPWRLTG
jgi:protein ImuA